MSDNSGSKDEPTRPLKLHANDDLVAEIKTRIVNRELKEAVLFDMSTGRIYSDLELESRRFLGLDAVMKIVFPMIAFDADSRTHCRVADLLIDLPDNDFSALRSVVQAEIQEGLSRLVVHFENLKPNNPTGAKEGTEQSDD
ncbi:hypothetical protein TRL7639_00056 [Falsiruegeria litorea R37]|uniref:Uncharacterized protein n=1 Tax=Falsiruegeria litorea R37 TaxID=1200284 RepID=A0A1Y5R9F6_9RHOB|nr:hypothetical protein [Falsiruegeria litorea]SLN11061.1 hypothetical protein TRL7639_00056 [Falsiruegeria litorea R37]